MPPVEAFLLAVVSYLIGSIPFSYLVARAVSGKDIRDTGSGNVGATNVVRNAGKKAGALALLLDIAKGWGSVFVARLLVERSQLDPTSGNAADSPAFWIGLAALLAVVGHMYPVWLSFRGGKGVATATGAFLGMSPLALGMAAIVFVIVIIVSRYVSLASIAGAAAVPVMMRFAVHAPYWTVIFSTLIASMVILKHHSNIRRLATRSERKFPK